MRGCRALTEVEIKDVLESFAGEYANRDRALFTLGVLSGFRVSELLSLKVGDVTTPAGQVAEWVSVARRAMKKKTEGRSVPLNPKARAALREWVEELRDGGHLSPDTPLFLSRKGGNRPLTRQAVHHVLKGVYVANGITGKTGTHSMRKTFAKSVYAAAVKLARSGQAVDPLTFCQKALGHRSVNSTISYLAVGEDLVAETILGL